MRKNEFFDAKCIRLCTPISFTSLPAPSQKHLFHLFKLNTYFCIIMHHLNFRLWAPVMKLNAERIKDFGLCPILDCALSVCSQKMITINL